jgi:ribosomal protein S27E
MAKILQCPGCKQGMDVTAVQAGVTVQCPECGQQLRVPSGNTSIRTKTVSAPIAATRPSSSPQVRAGSSPRNPRVGGGRSRSGTMPAAPPAPKSQGGLFVGLGIGVLGIVIVIIVFTMKGQNQDETPKVKGPAAPKGPGSVTFNPTLPPNPDKPIVLGEGNKGEPKTTQLSRPAETADNVNWPQLMQQLRPAGGFDHQDRPEGVAFQKVKNLGPAAYPKLVAFIDDEDTAIGIAAVAVLNALTGRDEPLPKGVNKGKVKAEWEAWLKNPPPPAKPDEPKK